MSNRKIKKQDILPDKIKINKNICKAERQNVVFSFEHMTKDKTFGITGCKDKDNFCALVNKLKIMSSKTWQDLFNDGKTNGVELMSVSDMKPRAQNALEQCHGVDSGDRVYIARFGDCRLIMRRGTKCGRVAQILAAEWQLGDAYDHGS